MSPRMNPGFQIVEHVHPEQGIEILKDDAYPLHIDVTFVWAIHGTSFLSIYY